MPARRWPVPVPHVFEGYRRDWLRGDFVAGVTVVAYLVPQVMAYAGIAGLPPVAGLWAALPAMVLYIGLGTSRLLSVGPESTTALMTAAAVGPLAAADPARYAVLAAALAVVVGLLCTAAWALRLGFVADLLSRPVLIGYMAGVALIMIVDQLTRLTGVKTSGSTFLPQVASFVGHIQEIRLADGRSRNGLPRRPARPAARVGRPARTARRTGAGHSRRQRLRPRRHLRHRGDRWSAHGASRPSAAERRRPAAPAPAGRTACCSSATPTCPDRRGPSRRPATAAHRRQPGTAGPGRGQPGRRAPARLPGQQQREPHRPRPTRPAPAARCTRSSPLVRGRGPALRRSAAGAVPDAPPSAPSSSTPPSAWSTSPSSGGWPRSAAASCCWPSAAPPACWSSACCTACCVAVALSVAELLRRVARPHDAVQGIVPGLAGMHDVDDYPQARTIPGLLVYRYDSPLFFANAEDFRRRALAAVDEPGDPVAWFVLNAEANVEVDITALDAVDALRRRAGRPRHRLRPGTRQAGPARPNSTAYGLTASVGADRIFPTLPTAVAAYRAWLGSSGGATGTDHRA